MSNEQDRFKRMVESSQDWFWEFDEHANFTYVSPRIRDFLGFEPEELVGINAFDLMDADEAERVHRHFDPIAKKYLPFKSLVNINRHKDGHEVVIESSGTPLFDEEGRFQGYQGVDRDITERKQIKEELRKKQQLLTEMSKTSKVGGWELNLDTESLQWTEEVYRIHEVGLDYVPTVENALDFYSDASKPVIAKAVQRAIEHDEPFDLELEIITAKGALRHVHAIGMADLEHRRVHGIFQDITERMQAEKILASSHEVLAETESLGKVGGWEFNIDTGKQTWSKGVYDIHEVGYEYNPTISTGIDFYTEESRSIIAAAVKQAIAQGESFDLELEIFTAKGNLRNVHVIGKADLKNRRVHGFFQDITEQKKASEALRTSQEMLAQTQQVGQVGSWQLETNSNHLVWSDETSRIFGIEPQAFVATYEAFVEAIHPDDRDSVHAAYSASLQSGQDSYEIEHRIIRKNSGEVRHVYEKCIHERDVSGAVIRSIGMVQDITERKSNEMALLAATQATESASRAKGLFLAKMSHELRTPMTAIIGFGELLEDADLTPEHKRYLAAINTSGNTLLSLIDDILDLSKVDAGELAVKTKEFRLHKTISTLVATQEQQIARKNLSFNISIESDVPDSLIGDPQRIQQVLLNLLGNAIKFTEKGDIGIAVSVVEDSNLRVLLNFAVRDTGIGISADRLGYIFEPFAQVLGSSHENYGGSGLGLTISRSLAGLMGGTVSVESQEGVGSTFHLLLPLQKNNDNLSEQHLPQREASPWCGPVLNILLAEDNPINSQFIKTVLEDMGHAVSVAENGKVALDTLKVNTFDLVLMDIQMPVMNGVDVLSVIREMEQLRGKHLTVIALTAYALFGDKEKYLKMGFDGYLSKPFKTKELMDEMLRVVSR